MIVIATAVIGIIGAAVVIGADVIALVMARETPID